MANSRRTRNHIRGPNNRCTACGEAFPCSTIVDEREMAHQVIPTATVRAHDLQRQLRDTLEALRVFALELHNRPGNQNLHEPPGPDMVAVAIEHVEQAIHALEHAGR